MLTLYYAPHTCALATHIALEESGAPYHLKRIDFATGEQRQAEYLAINPKGRVPALMTDQGILTETPALLTFVAQSYPQARLAPFDDPFAFAQLQSFNAYLCATVHVSHSHRMRGARWADDPQAIEAMKRKAPQNVSDGFAIIERELSGPWVLGERYSVSDMYLFTFAQWLEADGVDLSKIPRVVDHRRRMSERPSVMKCIADELSIPL